MDNLAKTYGRGRRSVQAVKSVTLEVPSGQVYGFLGPNGAGKSTTIRMLLDLIRPTQGIVYLYDRPVRRDPAVLRRVGAIVEDATFYGFLTGRRNLEVLARTGNRYDPRRIDALLEQVGLAGGRADRPVRSFSTGMKQRLGLAAALLDDPDLLILDEPTNGLDPAGIQEMRTLIRGLASEQGKTIFLSSHLLNEVEQVCDRVAIISRGEIVREGVVRELLSRQAQVRLVATPLERATAILGETWAVSREGEALLVNATREDVPGLVRRLTAQGVDLFELTLQRQSLEEYFLDATGEDRDV